MTRKEAEEWEKEFIIKLNSIKVDKSIVQEYREVLRDGIPLKLEEVLKRFIGHPDKPDCSERTLKEYTQQWLKFVDFITQNYKEITYLHEVNKRISSDFMTYIWETGVSENRYNKYKNLCSLIFRTLASDVGIEPEENPFLSFKSKKLRSSVSKEELSESQLMDVYAQTCNDLELQVLFALGMFTGMRLGDCACLKVCEVNFNRNVISKLPKKTSSRKNQHVIIPIHPELRKLLEIAHYEPQREYVIPGIANNYVSNPSGLSRKIQSIFHEAGIQTQAKPASGHRVKSITLVGFHSLRHSFVSICAKNKIPLAVVQALVGHGSPAMTRHYTHIGTESTEEAIKKIPIMNFNNGKRSKTDSEKLEEINGILKNQRNCKLKRQLEVALSD